MSSNIDPAIKKLQEFIDNHNISIKPFNNLFLGHFKHYKQIVLTIANEQFSLFVYDEYNDLTEKNQLLNLCLLFNELETYINTEDYLEWCRELELDSKSTELRVYYMDLRLQYPKIIDLIGTFESPIANYDFHLNAGPIQSLRKL